MNETLNDIKNWKENEKDYKKDYNDDDDDEEKDNKEIELRIKNYNKLFEDYNIENFEENYNKVSSEALENVSIINTFFLSLFLSYYFFILISLSFLNLITIIYR